MKHLIAVLLCLMLCGCTRQIPSLPPETIPEPTSTALATGLYDPDHPMGSAYPGLVRAYPLTGKSVGGILTLENDVLLLSGENTTTLTLFTGDDLSETACLSLDFPLQPEDPSLQIHENGISCFDPQSRETILLDRSLQVVRRIAAPDGLEGKPILSADAGILYYCTKWSVMAWDLESGIRRTVKELSYEAQELTALHRNGLVECSIRDSDLTTKLLLDPRLGTEIRSLPETAVLSTGNSQYFAVLPQGHQTLLVFGEADSEPQLLLPDRNWDQQFYLPEDHAAVTVSFAENGILLNYYELSTGILRSSLTLEGTRAVLDIANSKGHSVYILAGEETGCSILYRWDVLRQPPDPADTAVHTAGYRSADDPDPEALEDCREYARSIGEKYGIKVLVWEDTLRVQPWDYRFTPEHLAPVLQKELTLLDQRLSQYPETVLQQTRDHFTGITLCLVRQISGTGDDRSLSTATGIQFFEDGEAYVVITTGKYSEQALYHELYHVMETHILTESTALDSWEAGNPAGFVYGETADEIYLQGQTRAFVDRYSMTAAKEDRARVLENAMLSGKEQLFRSEYMQRKLHALCTGFREAYRLKKHPQPLPWEQYLVTPLAPET